jgi:hypothetical protein
LNKIIALLVGLLLPLAFVGAQTTAPIITSVVASSGNGGGGGGGGSDTTPDPFSFTDQTGVTRSAVVTSSAITVQGIDAAASITVTGGEYDINGSDSFTTSSGTVNNGDTVRARHTASASYSTATNTVITIGGSTSDTFTSTTEADPGVDPFAIDGTTLSKIPWHSSAGAWGSQVAIVTPEQPTTSTSTSVSTLAGLQAALGGTNSDCDFGNSGSDAASAVHVTLTASVSQSAVVCIFGNHIDIEYADGIVGPSVHIKNSGSHHIRVRGDVAGTRSATTARFGQIRGAGSHITVDGLNMNGNFGGSSGAETNQAFRLDGASYVGIYRVRALSGGYCYLGANNHVVIVDSNCMAGAMTNAQLFASGYASTSTNGGVGKWAMRHTGGGPITVVRSDFRNTMFNTLRLHSTGAANEKFASIDSRWVQYAEAKLAWAWASGGTGDGVVFRGGELWGFSECGGNEDIQFVFGSRTTDYGQIRDVTTYSETDADYTVAYLNGLGTSLSGAGGTADIANNSAVDPWPTSPTTGPAWDMNDSGDPMSLPLPTGDTPSYGEATCTGGGTGWPYR